MIRSAIGVGEYRTDSELFLNNHFRQPAQLINSVLTTYEANNVQNLPDRSCLSIASKKIPSASVAGVELRHSSLYKEGSQR